MYIHYSLECGRSHIHREDRQTANSLQPSPTNRFETTTNTELQLHVHKESNNDNSYIEDSLTK